MGNPKHADVLLITGGINEQNADAVRELYAQMPDPKVVVAIGICATSGCIFADCYNIIGGVDKVIPVDVYVPGCAARPEAIIDGIAKALEVLEEKGRELADEARGAKRITIETATLEDAPEILALQKLAFRSEAEIYGDPAIAPLIQSEEELKKDLEKMTFFKAVMSRRIVGAVRGYAEGETAYLGREMVDPACRHHGIGRRLVEHAERHFEGVKRFQVHTYKKSRQNIIFYQGLGFSIYHRERLPDGKVRVYMEKKV